MNINTLTFNQGKCYFAAHAEIPSFFKFCGTIHLMMRVESGKSIVWQSMIYETFKYKHQASEPIKKYIPLNRFKDIFYTYIPGPLSAATDEYRRKGE